MKCASFKSFGYCQTHNEVKYKYCRKTCGGCDHGKLSITLSLKLCFSFLTFTWVFVFNVWLTVTTHKYLNPSDYHKHWWGLLAVFLIYQVPLLLFRLLRKLNIFSQTENTNKIGICHPEKRCVKIVLLNVIRWRTRDYVRLEKKWEKSSVDELAVLAEAQEVSLSLSFL